MGLLKRVSRHGLVGTAKLIPVNLWSLAKHSTRQARLARQRDRKFDRSMGINTSGIIPLGALGVDSPSAASATYYQPVGIEDFTEMTALLPSDVSEFSFVDYGSGKGRALILAAQRPFKEVVGIEFSKKLHIQAEKNIAARQIYSRCKTVTSIFMDAADYDPPSGPVVVFLSNPFGADMVERVLYRVEKKHQTPGADAYLFYWHPVHQKTVFARPFWRQIASGRTWAAFKGLGVLDTGRACGSDDIKI
jgi:16S rRNA G966 N2-methylase RsmD